MWTGELFGTEKPVIALLHLDALPGEPAFAGSLEQVTAHAAADLAALQDGGADGVLIANENCFPITPHTDQVTVMAMAAVIGALKEKIRVPFGTNVVYDPAATIRMGAALGADFGRSAFYGAYTGPYGLHTVDFGEMVRLRDRLGRPDFKLLCKFNPEGDVRLGTFTNAQLVNSLCKGGFIGALCVSGPGAGQEASFDLLAEVSELAHKRGVPVFCNTGCRLDTIERILSIADGACVGTALKGDDGRVDVDKVRAFMEAARRARRDC